MSIFGLAKARDEKLDAAMMEAKKAASDTRSAVARLLSVIDNLPLEATLGTISSDLTDRGKEQKE